MRRRAGRRRCPLARCRRCPVPPTGRARPPATHHPASCRTPFCRSQLSRLSRPPNARHPTRFQALLPACPTLRGRSTRPPRPRVRTQPPASSAICRFRASSLARHWRSRLPPSRGHRLRLRARPPPPGALCSAYRPFPAPSPPSRGRRSQPSIRRCREPRESNPPLKEPWVCGRSSNEPRGLNPLSRYLAPCPCSGVAPPEVRPPRPSSRRKRTSGPGRSQRHSHPCLRPSALACRPSWWARRSPAFRRPPSPARTRESLPRRRPRQPSDR